MVSPRRRPTPNTLLLLTAALSTPASGVQGQTPREAPFVLVVDPTGWPELPQRLQGQLSDLPVTLRTQRGPRRPEGPVAHAQALNGLGDSAPARVATWVETAPDHDTLLLYVVDLLDGAVLVRELPAPSPTAPDLERSSTLESLAYAVRSALIELREGPPDGARTPSRQDEPRSETPPPRPWGLTLASGWTLRDDGASAVHHGPVVDLTVGLPRGIGLALTGDVTLPRRLMVGDAARARITRASLALVLRPTLWVDGGDASAPPRWRLSLGLGPCLIGFWRTTEAVDAGFAETPDQTTVVWGARGDLWLVAWPRELGGQLGIGATAGLDLVAEPPAWAVRAADGERRKERRTSLLQPFVGVVVTLRAPGGAPR